MRLRVTEARAGTRFLAPFGAPTASEDATPVWFVFLAVFAALLWPFHTNAESQAGAGAGRASLDFRIVVPAIVRVTAIAQPDQLRITEGDIARGYVDQDTGSSVTLTTNSRLGYLLTAIFDQQLLAGVEVRAANHSLSATSGSGSVHMASEYAIDKIVQINYRLYLAPGIRAGSYRWPVALQFSLGSA